MRREKIAISGTDVTGRSGTGAASQHKLITHKFAVIFAQGSRSSLESGISDIRTRRPLPNIAEHLLESLASGWLRMGNIVFQKSTFRWSTYGNNLPLFF